MKSPVRSSLITLLAAALLCGCSEGSPKVTSADTKAFAAAAPELKQNWADARAAANTNDYASAILTLRSMLAQNLSVEQVVAVQNAMRTYSVKLMTAADRGDASAQKALETLRSQSTRPGR
jgi:hypothetical protein